MGDAARQDRSRRELAGFRLVRLLARGGMAEVFLATRADELYALKRILPEPADSPARVARFVDEMQLAVTLDHPNVVQAFDFGEEEGTYWLLLELVHGVDLRKLVEGLREHATRHGERYPGQRAGILPPELVARIGLQIAHGLDYLHHQRRTEGARVIHRDISPENVMVDLHGQAKITDFGVSKRV
jgi:serine/threonine-protein kinase